jgi:hypothetical protein
MKIPLRDYEHGDYEHAPEPREPVGEGGYRVDWAGTSGR